MVEMQVYYRFSKRTKNMTHVVEAASGRGLLFRRSEGSWHSARRADLTNRLGPFTVDEFCSMGAYKSGIIASADFNRLYARVPSFFARVVKDDPVFSQDFRYMVEHADELFC